MSSPSDDQPNGLDEEAEDQYERLRRRLEEYGDDDIAEREEIGQNLDDIYKKEYYKLSQEDANNLLSFYITTSAIVEQECVLIINAHVFDFGTNGRGSIEFLEENLTQKNREEMLFCLGLIDAGLKGELSRVRKRRNELAHSHQHDEIEDIQQTRNDIKRAKNAKDKLKSIGVDVERSSV